MSNDIAACQTSNYTRRTCADARADHRWADLQASTDVNIAESSAGATQTRGVIDYMRVLEALPEPLLLIGLDSTILTANTAFLTATMNRLGAIAGKNLFEVFPDDPAEPTADGVARYLIRFAFHVQWRSVDCRTVSAA